MSPYDFPDAIQTAQAQDMSKVGAMQDLVRGVCRMTGLDDSEHMVVIDGGVTVSNLLRRIGNALRDGAFTEADALIEQVMEADATNAQVHLYNLLCTNRASTLEELAHKRQDWEGDANYNRAVRFAGEQQRAELALFDRRCRQEDALLEA